MAAGIKYAFFAILTLELILFALHLTVSDLHVRSWNSRSLRSTNSKTPTSVSISRRDFPVIQISLEDIRQNTSAGNKTQHTLTQNASEIPQVRSHAEKHRQTGRNDDSWDMNTESIAKTVLNDRTPKTRLSKTSTGGKGSFQPIDDKEAWLYSAHIDHVAAENGMPLVRVFGVVKREFLETVFCRFSEGHRHETTTGLLTALPDAHKREYLPAYVKCNLSKGFRPSHVSISFNSKMKPTNRLGVLYPQPGNRTFTVCYSILHSNYTMDSQLIFSIELNRILGAEHFVVYNNNVSSNIELILQQYQKDGLVTVLPWAIPTRDSWYFGQMTALNDCLYRNRNNSRFLVVLDTDEFIIPRSHSTWNELMDNVTRQDVNVTNSVNSSVSTGKGYGPICSFMVMSSFFSTNSSQNWSSLPSQVSFTDEEKQSIIKYKMHWFLKYSRWSVIFPAKVRSKYFARPQLVDISGIHFVQKFISDARYVNISEDLALVHHYRQPELPSSVLNILWTYRTSSSKFSVLQDTSLFKFKQKLYPRVMQRYRLFDYLFS